MAKLVGVRYPGTSLSRSHGDEPEYSYNGKTYHYNCADDSVVTGDYVVCKAPNGLVVVKVLEVSDQARTSMRLKWIVQKVDLKAWDEKVKIEQRKVELITQMEARVDELKTMEKLKGFAEHDPDMKKMLEELESLGS